MAGVVTQRAVGDVPALARRELAIIAAIPTVILIALSGRYGYHRDELYFIQCGRHLAWGYPDQPPFVPFLARVLTDIASTSLVLLRLPSALAVGGIVFVTGITARELGAGRPAQLLAAGGMAVGNFTIGAGHLLSTATFYLFFSTMVVALCVHAVRVADDRWWLLVGLVGGIGVLDSDLVAFLVAALVIGVLVAGPRRIFASPWFWAGAVLLVAIPLPYVFWQAHHGWPEFAIAKDIANGGSGTSEPWWLFIPFQPIMLGWLAVPIAWSGGRRLIKDPELAWCRAIPVAVAVLVVLFMATGGKPYYLGGVYPVVLAAGSVSWWNSTSASRRTLRWIPILTGLSLIGYVITLPILPAGWLHDSPVVQANYDAGETVAWPTYVSQIASVYDRAAGGATPSSSTIILTSNYGEAGAVDRFGGVHSLPSAFSVHNAFWLWGPPPVSATTVVAVGFDRSDLSSYVSHIRLARKLNNHIAVDDDEQGAKVFVCHGLKEPWTTIWPKVKEYG
jgi:hypothetical protein